MDEQSASLQRENKINYRFRLIELVSRFAK